MKKIVYSVLTCSLLVSSINAIECKKENKELKSVRDIIQSSPNMTQKDIGIVDGFRAMFEDGKTSGQLRSVYVSQDQKLNTSTDSSATAIGGSLKYETAKYNGVNAGFALTYSEDVDAASGDFDKGERSDELSSSDKRYAQLSEAYIAYEGCILDYKLGRQLIDTPLADSDDIRMIPNTFEAFIAQYPSESLNITLGFLNKWQGVDAGLDDEWVKTGESGTPFIGATYSNVVDLSLWYYSVSELTNAAYMELSYTQEFSDDLSLTGAVQYLSESELKNSGVEANIYGAMLELSIKDLSLGVAYNSSTKEDSKESFAGFGGGTLFTNMDTMIIDEITADRDASSYVVGASYAIGDFSLLYAYGSFEGDKDSLGDKVEIVEQDAGIEYNHNDELVAYLMFVQSSDELSNVNTDNDWDHIRVMLNYNF